ncbi:MAG: lipid-binding SYLF domain-containing protein [Candidatus Methylacidiphilales bacterium]
MLPRFIVISAIVTLLTGTSLHAAKLEDIVTRSAVILKEFTSGPAPAIPPTLLQSAKGLVILDTTKGGFIVSGSAGDGVVVARTKKGWTGPAFISSASAGIGLQVGAQKISAVFLLMDDAAVQKFAEGTEVKFAGNMTAVAGPDAASMSQTFNPTSSVYVYAKREGLFASIAFDGGVISAENNQNSKFYGKPVIAQDILTGKVPAPATAKALLDVLYEVAPPPKGGSKAWWEFWKS